MLGWAWDVLIEGSLHCCFPCVCEVCVHACVCIEAMNLCPKNSKETHTRAHMHGNFCTTRSAFSVSTSQAQHIPRNKKQPFFTCSKLKAFELTMFCLSSAADRHLFKLSSFFWADSGPRALYSACLSQRSQKVTYQIWYTWHYRVKNCSEGFCVFRHGIS